MKKILILSGIFIVLFWGFFGLVLFGFISPTNSDSMSPTYKVALTITYTNPFENPQVGDTVRFFCNNKEKCGKDYLGLITHRITEIKPDGCMVIIGDNPRYNWSDDPCFYPNEIAIRGVDRHFDSVILSNILYPIFN
jgi:hypothetical protein